MILLLWKIPWVCVLNDIEFLVSHTPTQFINTMQIINTSFLLHWKKFTYFRRFVHRLMRAIFNLKIIEIMKTNDVKKAGPPFLDNISISMI